MLYKFPHFFTALVCSPQNLALLWAPVEKMTFPFAFLHPTKHMIVLKKQMTSARITLKPGLWQKCCYCALHSPGSENPFLCFVQRMQQP